MLPILLQQRPFSWYIIILLVSYFLIGCLVDCTRNLVYQFAIYNSKLFDSSYCYGHKCHELLVETSIQNILGISNVEFREKS